MERTAKRTDRQRVGWMDGQSDNTSVESGGQSIMLFYTTLHTLVLFVCLFGFSYPVNSYPILLILSIYCFVFLFLPLPYPKPNQSKLN
ncbi:hypothetical protein BZA77DRAFT_309308 [Pyronema omphalodes]|nr:hypothetical protein BZA77DRAFT_309308 [Pyronema omphalodes]